MFQVSFPLRGKFRDSNESSSREFNHATSGHKCIFDDVNNFIRVQKVPSLFTDEVTQPHNVENVPPAIDEEPVGKFEEGVVPYRDCGSFFRSNRTVPVETLEFESSDFK